VPSVRPGDSATFRTGRAHRRRLDHDGVRRPHDDAAYAELESMVALLGRLHGVTRADAVALGSVAVGLRVTQIVNQVVGAHAVLRDGAVTTGG
jgi:acetamidase/formamidase